MASAHRAPEVHPASLFDVDPELGDALDHDHLAEARVRAVVATLELPGGPWYPQTVEGLTSRPFAVLVVDGLVVRDLLLAGSTTTELLGPGDLVDFRAVQDALLPTVMHWSVPDSARLAIVDDRVLAMLRTWPHVGRVLLERAAQRSARLVVHRAIAQLPRVDQRLLAYFAHLSERWGRVASAGMVVPLQLTHETLGRLIGARRPTVSLALKELSGSGLLERRGDGAWLLRCEAFDALATDSAASGRWQPADARTVPDDEEAGVPAGRAVTALAVRDDEEAGVPAGRAVTALTGLLPVDVAALADRVAALQAEHPARIAQCTTVLETVRATRRAREAERAAHRSPSPAGTSPRG
jgi:CRP/FNR family cyclic AMP-dependent transcriptional regulator